MAARRFLIQWTNRWSRESGYVGKVCKDHFENTFDAGEARKFASAKTAEKAVESLKAAGEGKENDFCVLEA